MDDEHAFCEKVRKLVLDCNDQFIEEIKAVRANVKRDVARENEGLSAGKPAILDALLEVRECLDTCMQIIEGKDRRLQSGIIDLNQMLRQAYSLPDNDDVPTGCNEALQHLRLIRDAASAAQIKAEEEIPHKWPKAGLRTAADGICTLLERHNHYLSAYDQGIACQLVGLMMDSVHSPKSVDSYRKAVQRYLESRRAVRDPSYKSKQKLTTAIAAGIKGKPFPE